MTVLLALAAGLVGIIAGYAAGVGVGLIATALVGVADFDGARAIAVVLVWGVLAALGVFSSVNDTIESVAGASSSVFNVEQFFSLGRVVGTAVVLAALNAVLLTVLATLFAFMYNLTVPFTRGIEVTLSEG